MKCNGTEGYFVAVGCFVDSGVMTVGKPSGCRLFIFYSSTLRSGVLTVGNPKAIYILWQRSVPYVVVLRQRVTLEAVGYLYSMAEGLFHGLVYSKLPDWSLELSILDSWQ